MILTDDDVLKAIANGTIGISPFNREALGSNSYDLTLNEVLLTYTEKILDCKKDNPTQAHIISTEGFVLKPGEFYLGATNEFTTCSKNLVPCIESKSSIARLGITTHLSAGFGDCSFSGSWTLEITVEKPIKIYPNMPIVQLYWTMTLGKCRVPYNMKKSAKYNNQPKYPVASKMHHNQF